ncbi:MAG: 4-hydroxy-3-methylbut-2-enyl diphosphate reductase [Endomicrobia bacterium]|nr:4-hydroxy-3-methylbut-2-enyl diphosphate reductase [Endomicrobiia bacterium]
MKEIIISKFCGFCSGVRRCISLVEEELISKKDVYTTGELIHNLQEMKRLESRGMKVLFDVREIENINKKITLIIRTHGIEKQLYEYLKTKLNIELIDGTCPIVKRTQQVVENYSNRGFNVIVYGDKKHPEIKALVSYISDNVKYIVIDSKEEIEQITFNENMILVSQTTKPQKEYLDIINMLKEKYKKIKVFDTICKETVLREKDVEKIAKKVDLMIVVGSKNSANTNKLVYIAKLYNNNVLLVEDERDLLRIDFSSSNKVGIISGSSTPIWLVEKIISHITT